MRVTRHCLTTLLANVLADIRKSEALLMSSRSDGDFGNRALSGDRSPTQWMRNRRTTQAEPSADPAEPTHAEPVTCD